MDQDCDDGGLNVLALEIDDDDNVDQLRVKNETKARLSKKRFEEARLTYKARVDDEGWFLDGLKEYDEEDGSILLKRTMVKYKTALDYLYLKKRYEECLSLGDEYHRILFSSEKKMDNAETDAIKACLLRAAIATNDLEQIRSSLQVFKSTKRWSKQVDSIRLIQEGHRYLGEGKEALDFCLLACTLDSRWENNLLDLGFTLNEMREYQLAGSAFERCLNLPSPHAGTVALQKKRARASALLLQLHHKEEETSSKLSPLTLKAIQDFLAKDPSKMKGDESTSSDPTEVAD